MSGKNPSSRRAGVGGIEPGGARVRAAESGNSQEIPFYSRILRPFPWVPTSPNPGKEKMKCYSGFLAAFLQPLATRVWSARGSAITPARPSSGLTASGECIQSPEAPGTPERAAARSPSSRRRPLASVPFSLSWCHMSRGGVGTRGVGGGVRAGKGPPSPPI